MTTALEIARILTCRESGYVHCQCGACRQSRVLEHAFTILFPNRDLEGELAAAAAAYRKARNTAAKEKVIHAFHLLLRRFDPVFSEKTEQVRKQIDALAAAMEEELQIFFQVDDRFEKAQDETLAALQKKARQLAEYIKSENISVKSLRKLFSWLRTKPADAHAVIILEGIENFVDASKNAMLKMLEEPPEKTTFILLTEGTGRIIPTILSRVRKYYFAPRSPEAVSAVISEVYFENPDSFDSLRTFFLQQKGIDCRNLREHAEYILNLLTERESLSLHRLEKMLKQTDEQKTAQLLFSELTELVREEASRKKYQLDWHTAKTILHTVSRCAGQLQFMKQKESTVLEACIYSLLENISAAGSQNRSQKGSQKRSPSGQTKRQEHHEKLY
jgi:DNA polymerase-3 subunit gamma/tau